MHPMRASSSNTSASEQRYIDDIQRELVSNPSFLNIMTQGDPGRMASIRHHVAQTARESATAPVPSSTTHENQVQQGGPLPQPAQTLPEVSVPTDPSPVVHSANGPAETEGNVAYDEDENENTDSTLSSVGESEEEEGGANDGEKEDEGKGDKDNDEEAENSCPGPIVEDEGFDQFEVEELINRRRIMTRRGRHTVGVWQYRVKWKGWPDATWQDEDDISEDLKLAYDSKHKRPENVARTKPKKRSKAVN